MSQRPTFYTPASVYWSGLTGSSVATMIPWVPTFANLSDTDTIAVISADVGGSTAGMYVKIVDPITTRPSWVMVMPMAALALAMSTNSTLTVVVNSGSTATYASPNVVYANGQVVSGGAIAVSSNIVYLIATPPMVAGGSFTVATLPAASTAGVGARSFVTDANAATFNTVAAGSGTNKVPVFSDGTAWRIG